MKKSISTLFAVGLSIATLFAKTYADDKLKSSFITGDPEIESINAIAFGPEGILFIGDSDKASIVAIDTEDEKESISTEQDNVSMQGVDNAIAEVFGTSPDNITIQDMAVSPLTKAIYFAIHHANGTPALIKLKEGSFEKVDLSNVSFSTISINDPVKMDAKDRRGRSQRVWAISDLVFADGKVMVTGLSDKEFSSTFRSLDFPFNSEQAQSSLEIYHAAHGKYETYAPVKTFTTADINGQPHIIASYTCTPLVLFPMSTLKPGEHTKGRTIAELGNWNTPLDMITMEKDGKNFLLLANSNRTVM
ncbi:MAG: hypothetical protein AAFY41_00610, partial [Bacteroidota bacterium]